MIKGFEFKGQWITNPHFEETGRFQFDTENDASIYYGSPSCLHELWQTTGTPEYLIYQDMLDHFKMKVQDTGEHDLYDVDMFCTEICENIFIEDDPQDIDEDNFIIFQAALMYLVHNDTIFEYYGPTGCAVLHADLMNNGEHYYVNKELWYKRVEA